MIAPGSGVVWWAAIDAFRPDHVDLLDEVERDKLPRLRQEADRARSALAAALLRLAVQEHMGVKAVDVVVDRSCRVCARQHGGPQLPGTGLWASVSHAGRWVAVALTGAGPIGVDVEQITEVDVEGLAATVLADDERAAVSGLRDFFICWTRKESVLKATGEGLSVPMRGVAVGRPDQPPALTHHPRQPGLRAQMFDLAPRDRHVAALAVLTDEPLTVHELDAEALLAPG